MMPSKRLGRNVFIQGLMSITRDGQRVICNGEGCQAEAWLPVALRPVLSEMAQYSDLGIHGWLFVDGRAGRHHFCPRCSLQYLGGLSQGSGVSDWTQEGEL